MTRKLGTHAKLAALALAIMGLLAFAATAQAATPATLAVGQLGPQAPSTIKVFITPSDTKGFDSRPGVRNVDLTPQGGALQHLGVFCVEESHGITFGTFGVELQTSADAADLAGAAFRQVAWLESHYFGGSPAGTPLADAGFEAAAQQMAVWKILGQADRTSNAQVNARMAELVSLAAAAPAIQPLGLSAAASSATVGTAITLSLTGTPGARVTLSAPSPAQLSATTVTLGADGTGLATVSSGAQGPVTVTAQADIGGTLVRIGRRAGAPASDPQNTAYVDNRPASVAVTFTAPATGPTPSTPTSPPSPQIAISPRPSPVVSSQARLAIIQTGPSKATACRTVSYTIMVTNRSSTVARNVVVRRTVPGSTYVVQSGRIVRKTIAISVGNIAPHSSKKVRVRVGVDCTASGRVSAIASAVAANAPKVSASSAAVIMGRPRIARVVPAVTG